MTITSTVDISARCAAILSDGIVVVVTWMKTFRHTRLAARVNVNYGLSALLLRDGKFAIMCYIVY